MACTMSCRSVLMSKHTTQPTASRSGLRPWAPIVVAGGASTTSRLRPRYHIRPHHYRRRHLECGNLLFSTMSDGRGRQAGTAHR